MTTLTQTQIKRALTNHRRRIQELLQEGCPEDAPIIQMHQHHIGYLQEHLQTSGDAPSPASRSTGVAR